MQCPSRWPLAAHGKEPHFAPLLALVLHVLLSLRKASRSLLDILAGHESSRVWNEARGVESRMRVRGRNLAVSFSDWIARYLLGLYVDWDVDRVCMTVVCSQREGINA